MEMCVIRLQPHKGCTRATVSDYSNRLSDALERF